VVPAVAAPPLLAWLNSIVPMARGRLESTGKRVVAAATVRRGVCSAIPIAAGKAPLIVDAPLDAKQQAVIPNPTD
jgi:hypothetical protein